MNRKKKIKILAVCLWPWGGLRTYMKYNYHYFPKDEVEITLLADPMIEKEYLEKDMKTEGIRIVWAKPFLGRNILFLRTARMLMRERFDLIHSHGYITAFHVSLVSRFFRIPHVFTIHSILVAKFFQGMAGKLKRFVFTRSMRTIDVFHGVSEDIIEYSKTTFPALLKSKAKWVVIESGIQTEPFLNSLPGAGNRVREKAKVEKGSFIFGFFGRLEPEKGFNFIIDSVEKLKAENRRMDFVVMAVGHGMFENEYKSIIEKKRLAGFFRFLPFDPDVASLMKGCDAILTPSVVEGRGLVACEALCAGIPLIATDCLALRETVRDTPTIVIRPQDAEALAGAMSHLMSHPELKQEFAAFQTQAAARFDVKYSAEALFNLFKDTLAAQSSGGKP